MARQNMAVAVCDRARDDWHPMVGAAVLRGRQAEGYAFDRGRTGVSAGDTKVFTLQRSA